MLEELKEKVYLANMELPKRGLVTYTWGNVSEIDGATGIRQFFDITVPLLSPTTFFIVQTRVIGALTIFDLMFMVLDKTNLALRNVESAVYVFSNVPNQLYPMLFPWKYRGRSRKSIC